MALIATNARLLPILGVLGAEAAGCAVAGRWPPRLAPGFRSSGGWCHAYVEGELLGAGIVVAGVSLESERDGRQGFALGVGPGRRPTAVDVQGWHAMAILAFAGPPLERESLAATRARGSRIA